MFLIEVRRWVLGTRRCYCISGLWGGGAVPLPLDSAPLPLLQQRGGGGGAATVSPVWDSDSSSPHWHLVAVGRLCNV